MKKIKSFVSSDQGKDVLLIMIVILVGLASFGLGRLSKETTSTGIKIQNTDYPDLKIEARAGDASVVGVSSNTQKSVSESPSLKSGNFLASKRGKKYYPISCSAGKSIKQENRIYFETREDAEHKGYSISGSCK
ncbi:MAG: hypothetical protein M3P22_02150 [bacterium]|nr:hypothetical protein [bacterium]